MAAVMFLRKAMRYYRLWIYTCNAVLLVSVFVFMGVAAGVVSHPYFSLVPAPPAYHPTLLYGYVALLLQAGILQALGCMGALRLSQKLLNIYWLMLLFLLLGDVVVGLVWLYRFSHLTDGLRPYARATLHNKYGRDPDITDAWDTLQRTSKCCGVVTPRDYNTTWWDIREQNFRSTNTLKLPPSCCTSPDNEGRKSGSPDSRRLPSYQADQQARHVPDFPPDEDKGTNSGGSGKSANASSSSSTLSSGSHNRHGNLPGVRGRHERNLTCLGSKGSYSSEATVFYEHGCHPYLEKWLLNSTETLMILGFCVIAFIKLCFVGILRFEIQEMIQKIKVLQGETSCTPNPELAAALGLVSPDKAAECGLLSSGGGDGENRGTGGGGDEGGGGGGGDNQGDQDSPAATPLTQPRLNHLSGHTDGAESDTNSHCALITDTPIRRPQPDKRKPNGNNNDVTELRELRHIRQTQI
ncbi:uncharacterized protein LOC135219936 [Macrobrachium nipponense]|uniref:uncharacterized protein LOC135219936 n=1 Tax=Macrobrachium nipponense TaxID=159736 RepID=UPI0030C7E794